MHRLAVSIAVIIKKTTDSDRNLPHFEVYYKEEVRQFVAAIPARNLPQIGTSLDAVRRTLKIERPSKEDIYAAEAQGQEQALGKTADL